MEPDHRAEARAGQVRALPRVLRRKRGRGRAVDEAGEDGDGVGVTRRSMKRAAASVRWVVLSFLSLRRRCLRQSMRPTRGSTFPTPMIYALEFYSGLAKTPAGRTIDRTRSAPSRGFIRPMEASRRMLSRVECTTREESSRQIRACAYASLCNQRAKTSASRSIGRTSPPFASVQPRRRRLTDHDQDANEGFETKTRRAQRIYE